MPRHITKQVFHFRSLHRRRLRVWSRALAYALLGITLLPAGKTWAQTRVWNGSDSSWTTAANWSPAIVPFLNSDVEINAGISSLSAASGQSQDVYIGRTADSNGTLHTLSAGQLRSRLVYLGDNATGNGGATVTGLGSKWTVDSGITVGRFGDGILGIAEHGELAVSGGASYIGREVGALGIVHVDGAGSKWTGGELVVGRAGEGRLSILSGAEVTNNRVTIGDLAASVGDALLNLDSKWNLSNNTLVVGNNGKGTLQIVNRADVTSGDGRVGLFPTADGVVIVEGADSTWTIGGLLEVGTGGGSGIVQILSDATVGSAGGAIGGTATSDAEVRLDGRSKWTNSSYLEVRSGGALLLKNTSRVESASGEIDGADIDARGTVNIESDSVWAISGNLTVGDSGYGKLTISDEFNDPVSGVGNTTATLGFGQNSDAEVVVRGAGAKWSNSGRLTVGNAGDARLTITEGGQVTSITAIIADNVTSQSTVIVEGTGSKWEVTGTVAGGIGALVVGDTNGAGTEGTLVVRDGGVVESSGPAPSPLSGNVHVQGKGKLMGDGKVIGSVYNVATVAPGYVHEITGDEIRGTLHIDGDYKQFGGNLQIELGADAYDKLEVSGAFNLNFATNRLEVTLDEGFVPLIGQSFDILDWGSTNMNGVFGPSFMTILPALPGGRVWDLGQLYTSGVIAVGGFSTVIGDYNGNGVADAADYVVLRNDSNSTPNQFNLWRGNFGSHGSGAGTSFSAIPEPTTFALAATYGLLVLLLWPASRRAHLL